MHWTKITLVGVGLLGGSLGLALKRRGLADLVVGYVRRPVTIDECLRLGAVDLATCDLQEAVRGADLVILCTPIAQMLPLVKQMLPALKRAALVTDVGSVKASVVRDLEPLVAKAGAEFVGSHPMAGSEKTGVSAATATLFENAVCVVTPSSRSCPDAVQQVEGLWRGLGSRLLRLTPEQHDDLVSRSSHLPHLLAALLAGFVLDPARPKEQALLCANGFRDTTRVASGSPEMWRDIVLANRDCLLATVRDFRSRLQEFERDLEKRDGQALGALYATAKQRRDQWTESMSSPSPE